VLRPVTRNGSGHSGRRRLEASIGAEVERMPESGRTSVASALVTGAGSLNADHDHVVVRSATEPVTSAAVTRA
jgi:hypothetical protein